jgi:glycosyltransferase involved in cell wall biosynthesis
MNALPKLRARPSDCLMRVLFVSKHFPRDLRTSVNGVFQRLRMFVDAWKEVAQLHLLFYVSPDVDTSPAAVMAHEAAFRKFWDVDVRLTLCPQANLTNGDGRWRDYAKGASSLFRQPGYAETSGALQVRVFEDLVERGPDVIFVHRLASMCPALLTEKRLPPILFDLDDVEHVSLWRAASHMPGWKGSLAYCSRLPGLCWGERRALNLASRTFVCSESDRRYLENIWRAKGVHTIPNGVEIGVPPSIGPAPSLMFIGSYRYGPNVQAAEFLLEKIWPRVLQRVANAELWLVGPSPENIGAAPLERPGVKVPGFVEDLSELYLRARVICCPIFVGAGTRIKILEAAAHARPVVSTRIGAEGLDLTDGRELLLRDDAESFAAACIELLTNRELCQRLGAAAYEKARQDYDRRAVLPLIRSHLAGESVCREKATEKCPILQSVS